MLEVQCGQSQETGTLGRPSHREALTRLWVLPSELYEALIKDTGEKSSCASCTWGKKRKHFEIHQSILLFLTRSGLRRNYFTEPNLLGVYQSLEDGKYPNPAHSRLPRGGEEIHTILSHWREEKNLRSTGEVHSPGPQACKRLTPNVGVMYTFTPFSLILQLHY